MYPGRKKETGNDATRSKQKQEYSLTAECMQKSREEFCKDAMTQDTVSQVSYESNRKFVQDNWEVGKLSATEWHRYTEGSDL